MIPSILKNLVFMLIEALNLVFIGQLNNQVLVAAVGVGNMTSNLVCMSIVIGFNSVLDTLISQAAGAGNYELCGVYRNRGMFIMTIIFIPASAILLCSERILIAVG